LRHENSEKAMHMNQRFEADDVNDLRLTLRHEAGANQTERISAAANTSLALAARLVGVTKEYQFGTTKVDALRGVDLSVEAGLFAVIRGPSGSGKSTLLNLLGCIDTPSQGRVEVAGADVTRLSDVQKTEFRAHHIGFVFQSFNLLPVLSALENVEYPLQLSIRDRGERRRRAREALEAVGLGGKLDRYPTALSGGERQRVAVARAIVKRPALVLADEPTANLDRRTGAELIALMRAMQRSSNTTFVFCSHDPQLIDDADLQIRIEDGCVIDLKRAGETNRIGGRS
jgi:putative ABC transport system ATP-binding protein